MKVEILTDFQHKGQNFITGEIRVVDDATGEYFCRAGWVKDLDGVIPTASPSLSDTVLEVQPINQTTFVENT